MSHLNLNNVLNLALVLGAVVSAFGLTARARKAGERPEPSDLAGITKTTVAPPKPNRPLPPEEG